MAGDDPTPREIMQAISYLQRDVDRLLNTGVTQGTLDDRLKTQGERIGGVEDDVLRLETRLNQKADDRDVQGIKGTLSKINTTAWTALAGGIGIPVLLGILQAQR